MKILDEKNKEIGTYSQDEKSINFNLNYNDKIYNLSGKNENNTYDITLLISQLNNNTKIDLININTSGTIGENPDFSNIDIKDKIKLNDIKEEDKEKIGNSIIMLIFALYA